MGKQPKPFESPLSPRLADEILNIPVSLDGEGDPPRTIGEMVRRSVEMIDRTNEHLRGSHVAKIVAKSLMQDLKKRGDARIVVRYDGTVVLRVEYGDSVDAQEMMPRARRDAPAVQTTHKSDLPYLDELRAQAEELSVDISHLGRQRRAIHDFLLSYRTNLKPGVDQVTVTPLEEGGRPSGIPRRRRRDAPPNGHGHVEPTSEVELDDLLELPPDAQ